MVALTAIVWFIWLLVSILLIYAGSDNPFVQAGFLASFAAAVLCNPWSPYL